MKIPFNFSNKKKILFVGIFVLLLIGAGVGYWQYYLSTNKNNIPKEIRESAALQEKLRLSDADANKINTFNKASTEISGLAAEQKFAEAKIKLDELAKNQADNSSVQDSIYGLYVSVCSGLLDASCMSNTLEHFKSNNEAYFIIAVDFAEATAAANKLNDAKRFNQIALELADKNGGLEFVENINKTSQERQYNYNQIKLGSL